ncbi:SWIM zinc finger family protein [Salinigranum rubrum]|uniref:SWIM zinc finger family protein n=1 Tax=Salinigranum rubrum TaxID=755307 RepID=UPI000D6C4287|nr:SWIM zinc finger family protein [Salinigranum rubrum]
MTAYESDANECIEPRTERALNQYLTVLPDYDRARGADDLFMVVSQSGKEYLVDTRLGACECPDHEHLGVRCKHLRRVAFAMGERPIPAGVDGVDPQLGEHVYATPQVAATDGGIIDGSDDASGDEQRPDDCDCGEWNADSDLPCWPCAREKFDQPATNE